MNISDLTNTFLSLGIILAGCGYLLSILLKSRKKTLTDEEELEKTNNRREVKNHTDILKLMEDRLKSLRKIAQENQKEINTLREQIARLTGILEEKEKKIKELVEILQNRNPQLDEFIKKVTPVVEQVAMVLQENRVLMSKALGGTMKDS